ncbi:hypothetical protein U9M48_024716 [Paspalum notatum var. saurae]|uniref:GDSL esterase/lipase n=1 Tax=Paspalum notatum var. saurae TaxID=547442 RepID=A0AAQ3WWE1_PASNO
MDKGRFSIFATILAMVTMASVQALGGQNNSDGYLPMPPLPSTRQPLAIFVFGDGALDVGNNNDLTGGEMGDPPRANRLYYGIDFPPGNNPTGRFSNGFNIADFIAKAMGFVMSPPAYRSLPDPFPDKMEGFTGVNYASANAGIQNSTYANMTIPLSMQVANFAKTRAQLKSLLGGRKPLNKFLSKSLFLIGLSTGMDLVPDSNPFAAAFPPNDNKTQAQRLRDLFGATLTTLHGMGARKFGVINVGLIGCTPPVQSSPGHGGDGPCSDDMNRRAAELNAAVGTLLSDLATKLHHFRYALADFYGFSNATFGNPSATGFANTNSACCPGLCAPSPYYSEPCSNRTEYWFWDEGYTTEQAANLAADAFYSGKMFVTPVSFKRLIATRD